MPLLNYTTTINPAKTAAEVQAMLVTSGARSVMTNYDDKGNPIGLAFRADTPMGERSFSLPVNTSAVELVLKRQRVAPKLRTTEQAHRVAWRILKDWVEAQLAILSTEMVTIDQVMLPYMTGSDGTTVYELYVGQQLALEPGESEPDDDVVDAEVIG